MSGFHEPRHHLDQIANLFSGEAMMHVIVLAGSYDESRAVEVGDIVKGHCAEFVNLNLGMSGLDRILRNSARNKGKPRS